MPFTPFVKGGGKAAAKPSASAKDKKAPAPNPFAKKSGQPKKTRRSPF